MNLSEFDYNLPQELIAQNPAERRDRSRLLVFDYKSNEISHHIFGDISKFLKPGDLLVLNSSKVFPARLIGKKELTGGVVEIFLSQAKGDYTWETIGKGLKVGARISFQGSGLKAQVTEKSGKYYHILFNLSGEKFYTELEKIGRVPLPPYIKRQSKNQKLKINDHDVNDSERYQTVYAKERGSVAAPTAGLHFTRELLQKIQNRGVALAEVVLHVGLGTFAPIESDEVEKHKMHREYYSISQNTINKIEETKQKGGRVIAVGTTTCRVLETVFHDRDNLRERENESESINNPAPQKKQNSCQSQASTCFSGWTDIFIYPPYQFKCVDGLITNFHLPKSSLLLLVSAFAGKKNIEQIYVEAIREKYRFYSYGDAMLLINTP